MKDDPILGSSQTGSEWPAVIANPTITDSIPNRISRQGMSSTSVSPHLRSR